MKSLFVVITFILSYSVQAQKPKPDSYKTDFSKIKSRVVKLAVNKINTSVTASFIPANITILDYRFDTNFLGFLNKKIYPKKRLIPEHGTSYSIEMFLRKLLKGKNTSSTTADELVAIVQKLYLSDDLVVANRDRKSVSPMKSGIVVRIAYFLKNEESCFPLYKFDSVITDKYPLKSHAGYYLATALAKSVEKMGSIDIDRIVRSDKKYTLSYIKNVYGSRFQLPLLSQLPQKGVYLSFDEFRQNKPSITKFRVGTDGETDHLYCDDGSGKEVLLRKLFAFSDGKNFYLWSSDNFYKLYRSGNTFNFFGSRQFYFPFAKSYFIDPLAFPGYLVAAQGGMAPNLLYNNNSGGNSTIKRKMYYYQLDMETGIFN